MFWKLNAGGRQAAQQIEDVFSGADGKLSGSNEDRMATRELSGAYCFE
jgi:hypothetical protein